MGQNSSIEWTDHTLAVMQLVVALLTKRDAIGNDKTQIRIVSKGLDVMSNQVTTASIAASLASEVVTSEYIEAPSLVLSRESLVSSLNEVAIFITMASLASRRSLSGYLTNPDTGFNSMALTDPVARSIFRRSAHLAARLFAHLFALAHISPPALSM